VEVAPNQETEGYYITWFCVVRPEKETTKVRTVFNCAQNFGKFNPKCLNDGMYTGPKLHNELFDIILRMRQRRIFVGADISKFYMRIRMAEEDQKFHRFYWRGKAYQFTRWRFGNKAAPFAALYVVQRHIKTHGSQKLQEAILPCMYMDDILFSVDTVVFKPKTASTGNLTRRRIASIVSSIFDPLGWLNPYTLEGRVVLQAICKKQDGVVIKWDTDLDKLALQEDSIKVLLKRFRKWEKELPLLDKILYP
jgi:hypothetical protein